MNRHPMNPSPLSTILCAAFEFYLDWLKKSAALRLRLPEVHIRRCGEVCPWCSDLWLVEHAMQDAKNPTVYHMARFGLN